MLLHRMRRALLSQRTASNNWFQDTQSHRTQVHKCTIYNVAQMKVCEIHTRGAGTSAPLPVEVTPVLFFAALPMCCRARLCTRCATMRIDLHNFCAKHVHLPCPCDRFLCDLSMLCSAVALPTEKDWHVSDGWRMLPHHLHKQALWQTIVEEARHDAVRLCICTISTTALRWCMFP
jgi:hypothetical protein